MKMNKKNKKRSVFAAFLLIIFLCSFVSAADWANWRGPNYNGISAEKDWDPSKIKEPIKPLWKASLGIGFSTVSVSDGKVYVSGNTGKKGTDKSKHKDVIFCFDAETGKQLWKHSYPQQLDPKFYEGGTLASPTVAGGKVYTISKDGKAFCLDAKTGSVIWRKNLLNELGVKRTTWGQSGSPLIVDNMVIYNVGAKGVALNKGSGDLLWQSGTDPSGYATAVPFMNGDQKCIALFSFSDIIGLDATTGKELWRYPWKTKYDVNAADPIIAGNLVFISSGYNIGCGLLKVDGANVTELWRNKNMRNKINGSVLWEGHIYGVDEGGELRCLNFKTGELLWVQEGFGMGSLMIADGKLIVLGEKGNLVVAETSPAGYKPISQANILSGSRCWSVPVLANGRIYARNAAGDMVCLDVKKKSKVSSAGGDWPQWQGPARDNISRETGLLKKWPQGGPELLWSAEGLGAGYATVSVSDGTIYTTGTVEKEGFVFASDLGGKLKWKSSYGTEWTKSYASTRSTPTVDGGSVYIVSGVGAISCFDSKTGAKRWTVDTFSDFGGKYPRWGMAESPLVYKDTVICTPGGDKASIVALNKHSGKVVWMSESLGEKSAYCSPILIQRGGKDIIVTTLEKSIVGLEADTGKILFSDSFGKRGINPQTPMYHNGCIYMVSGYGDGGVMYELSEDGMSITRKWTDKELDNHHGGVVLVDGYIYGTTHNGKWVCLYFDTGEVKYKVDGIGKGSVSYADGMLYCYEEKEGVLALVRPTPEKFDVVSSFKIEMGTDQHWAHPVICDGRMYIRHGDALMAYDVKIK